MRPKETQQPFLVGHERNYFIAILTHSFSNRAQSCLCAALLVFIVSAPHAALAKSVFLNGVDISSARGQALKNVDIRIDENGDVQISAPHYQVLEEDSYTPLASWVQSIRSPEHRDLTSEPPISKPASTTKTLPKAGSKSSDDMLDDVGEPAKERPSPTIRGN